MKGKILVQEDKKEEVTSSRELLRGEKTKEKVSHLKCQCSLSCKGDSPGSNILNISGNTRTITNYQGIKLVVLCRKQACQTMDGGRCWQVYQCRGEAREKLELYLVDSSFSHEQ